MENIARKNKLKKKIPKAAVLLILKRRSVANAGALQSIHHSVNTKRGGNIQAPAILAITKANTHNANAHGHSTIAVIN